MHAIEGTVGETCQYLVYVGDDCAHVLAAHRFELKQQAANTRAMYVNTQEILLRVRRRHTNQCVAVAEADVDYHWSPTPENRTEIERRFAQRHTIARPQFFQRAPLRRGHAALAQDITTNRPMRRRRRICSSGSTPLSP